MIDHREGNQVDVNGSIAARGPRDALSIDENQSFSGQQAAQVNLDSAVTDTDWDIGSVLVEGGAHFLRQPVEKIRCVANAQFLDVQGPIGIHRVRTDFFCGWNVGTGHNDAFHFRNAGCFLSQYHRGQQQTHCRNAPSHEPHEWSLDDELLSLNLPLFSKLCGKEQMFSQRLSPCPLAGCPRSFQLYRRLRSKLGDRSARCRVTSPSQPSSVLR